MFTGIITNTGIIADTKSQGDMRVAIACDFASDLTIGESVAVNGCCLTVVAQDKKTFSADLSSETLECTAPHWQKDSRVNLERSLKLGDRLDGHLVTGHVDGVATIKNITPDGDSHILECAAPTDFSRFIATKGSVTLNGISLTVNKVAGEHFWVNIIPHTWQHTTLGKCQTSDKLNIEIDLMARYAARLLPS